MKNAVYIEFIFIPQIKVLCSVALCLNCVHCVSGLDVATCGVANATGFGPLTTNFSRMVASLATAISNNISKMSVSVSSGVPNTEKVMKLSRCLEPLMTHEARVFDMASQMKQ